MSVQENRKIIFSVIGGVALLGLSYFIYKKVSEADPVTASTGAHDDITAKIKALGTPTKGKDDKIVFEYIIQFAEVVGRESRVKLVEMLESNKSERRQLLKDNNLENYHALIEKIVKAEDQISDDVLGVATKVIGLTPEEFCVHMEHHTQNQWNGARLQKLMEDIQSSPVTG